MNKKMSAVFLMLFAFTVAEAQVVSLKKAMIIKKSMKIKRATYQLEAPDSLSKAVILIEGNNITIDFNHATLNGNVSRRTPDAFKGVALMIRRGKNITIRNLKARGYKIALIARNVEGLKIENCDFSYNYRQHLNSTQEKEDLSDWMSYHHNEADEWLRYGAAMYLRNCNNAVVSNCKVTGGQNALMLMECNNGLIYNNDFSFNSGIGLGLYKSSSNKVLYNKLNFNVRGYSHGVYNRGQDSAGILVYEQSNENIFFKNSVTHSGDGFFLWAGQTTMDTGKGGCNDNEIRENDFSYAPANGIEATFSRNAIIRNRIFECDYGIWGGYSFNTAIRGNQFRNNRIAIAIEHGQHNDIVNNIFSKDKEAIKLWSAQKQPSNWGYATYRDTRSVGYLITTNSFNLNELVYNITATDSLHIFGNTYARTDNIFKIDSSVTNIDSSMIILYDTTLIDPTIKNPIDPFKGNGKLAGRKNIMMTEWGPYDFRYPLIWNTNPLGKDTLHFDVLAPEGSWKIISASGIDYLDTSKQIGGIKAVRAKSGGTDIEINAAFTGKAFTDQFGNSIPANKPYRFQFRQFFQPIDFSVSWYAFDSTTNPINTNYLERVKTQRPFKAESVNKLDYAWWGGIKHDGNTYSQFLTIAEGNAEVAEGNYEMSITWDDAVRVYVDGKLVVDEWNPSKYTFDESPNRKVKLRLGGMHVFRVEHVELGGFAVLSMKLNKL